MIERLIGILQIPARCLLKRKLPKTFFKRNFELTISEKKLLDDFSIISSIDWIGSISPANINISKFEAGQYIYEEVEIISVQTNPNDFEANAPKIAELVQKYIPYPVLLCVYYDNVFVLNTCEKRINQNDNTRRTIEHRYNTPILDTTNFSDTQVSFISSIAFGQLDKTNLKTFYDGYSQAIIALQASAFSGIYTPRSKERSNADVQILLEMQALQNEIANLLILAKKETQLSQQVEINMQVQQKRQQIQQLKSSLKE